MPVQDKYLKRDKAQIPVPQYFDNDLDDFVPLDNGMYIKEAQVQMPMERQGILYRPLTLQTSVIIATLANNATTNWQDTDGASSISVNVKSDSNSGKFTVTVVWSDDLSNIIGAEQLLPSGVAIWDKSRAASTDIKAKYFKVIIINDDTATHTFSAYAGLKG